jgi:hypothetical protein
LNSTAARNNWRSAISPTRSHCRARGHRSQGVRFEPCGNLFP